jgi:hypothetical protein
VKWAFDMGPGAMINLTGFIMPGSATEKFAVKDTAD